MSVAGSSINRHVRALALVALVAAGCAGLPGNQGAPDAPLVVRGTIYNKLGVPYSGADLELKVVDVRGAQDGQLKPLALNARFTSSVDGTFAIHLAPTELLSELAAGNGGSVEFELVGSFPEESRIPPFTFSREVSGSGWAGTAPVAELRPPAPTPEPTFELPPEPSAAP
jgi:hypothetical protein